MLKEYLLSHTLPPTGMLYFVHMVFLNFCPAKIQKNHVDRTYYFLNEIGSIKSGLSQKQFFWWVFPLLFFLGNKAFAQGSKAPVSPWKDGLYLSLEQFQSNSPAYYWREVKGKWFSNPGSGLTTVADLTLINGSAFPLDSLWAICIEGQPSLRIPADSTLRSSAIFAKLIYPGRISLFTYEGGIVDTVSIAAYNPVSGKPFRQARLPRITREFRERIFVLETGQVLPFSQESLVRCMEADPEVRRAVSLLEVEEREEEETEEAEKEFREKLLRAIEVFNERNRLKFR